VLYNKQCDACNLERRTLVSILARGTRLPSQIDLDISRGFPGFSRITPSEPASSVVSPLAKPHQYPHLFHTSASAGKIPIGIVPPVAWRFAFGNASVEP
jgi:hypothetical protein